MSAKNEQTLRRLVSSIKQADRSKTSAYDTQATVRRIEDGVAWVHIPGGVDETPVKLTIAAAPGDTVQVRVSGGRAFLVGNATAPPTDDTTAKKAVSQIGVVNKAVKAVQRIAEQAAKIAGNTNQYFWHTESGTDTGAHITEIPQAEFLADPENGGGNLLARSTGIAIRDGLKEVATFARNGMSFILPNRNAYEDSGEILLERENVGELGSLWVSNLYGKWAALRSIDGNASLWGKTASIFAPSVYIANYAPGSNDVDPEDCAVTVSGTLTVTGAVTCESVACTGGQLGITEKSFNAVTTGAVAGAWSQLGSISLSAGSYIVIFGAAFATNATGYRQLHFGQSLSAGRYSPSYAAASGDQTRINHSITVSVTSSATYYLWARQNSGSDLGAYGYVQIVKLK